MGFIADAFSPRRLAATADDLSDASFWSNIGGFMRKTTSGETVTPSRALTLAAYFAAIRVISEDLAKLPVHVYRSLKPRGKECVLGDPVGRMLLHRPNPEMSAYTFRETMTQWTASWGNGYAEIVRDGAGIPRELWPIHPSRVRVMRDAKNRLFYRVTSDFDPTNPVIERTTSVDMAEEDIFHLRGMGNAVIGYSVATFAAETLGVALATQSFGAAFFGNGTQGGGILIHPKALSDTAKKNLRESWNSVYGSSNKAYRVKILEEGVQFTNTFVPPNEAQFIETREFQIEDIARWFRIAPHKIGHLKRSTFSNIEQQSIEHVTDCLMPWATRWEQEVKRSLLGDTEDDVFLAHDFNGLLRGDANARANFYRTMVNIGAYSPNDVRESEDENPIPGDAGDAYYMQTNMSTLDRIQAGTVPGAAGAGRQAKPPVDDGDAEPSNATASPDTVRAWANGMRPVIEAAADRVLRKLTMGITRAAAKKGGVNATWAEPFFQDIGENWLQAIGPAATALNEWTANLVGSAVHPLETSCWTESWREHRDAVVAAGDATGLPPGLTPTACTDEIIRQVLIPYGITP